MTSVGTVVSGPVPPYSNPPIQPYYYQPSQFFINGVTLGQTTTVTTTTDLNYVVGQLVRLLIPESFGCYQLNGVLGYVLDIPASNQVVLSIDSSRNVNAYKTSTATTVPQIVAVGDINSGVTGVPAMVNSIINLPGAFINIS